MIFGTLKSTSLRNFKLPPRRLPLNRIGIIAGHNAAFLLHDTAWSAWTARQLAILSDRVVLHFQDSDRSYTT
jgi:hypothetical protein